MKARTVLILCFAVSSAFPAMPVFANGPMPADPAASTSNGTRMSSSNRVPANMAPGRETWTRKRLKELKVRRQQINQRHTTDATDIYSGMQQMHDPFATTAADRRREAVARQRDTDLIEFLAIKKERGELSPAGDKKLKELLRHYRREY